MAAGQDVARQYRKPRLVVRGEDADAEVEEQQRDDDCREREEAGAAREGSVRQVAPLGSGSRADPRHLSARRLAAAWSFDLRETHLAALRPATLRAGLRRAARSSTEGKNFQTAHGYLPCVRAHAERQGAHGGGTPTRTPTGAPSEPRFCGRGLRDGGGRYGRCSGRDFSPDWRRGSAELGQLYTRNGHPQRHHVGGWHQREVVRVEDADDDLVEVVVVPESSDEQRVRRVGACEGREPDQQARAEDHQEACPARPTHYLLRILRL